MGARSLIWVDLRVQPSATDLYSLIRGTYQVRYIQEPSLIPQLITTLCPVAACFQYDLPGTEQLAPLQRTRLEFPSLPVLMITVEHWEELAVWALRMRVSDYLVVPAGITDLCSRIEKLVGSLACTRDVLPDRNVPVIDDAYPVKQAKNAGPRDRLLPALSYLEANYSEKVAMEAVARLCGMGRFQFSRIFKKVYGTTFREFLIAHRINKAIRMLDSPGVSITDVAFSVGFNDLSHFAQMFRRYVGVCPSDYLHDMKRCEERFTLSGNITLQNTPIPLQRNPSAS